MLDVLVKENASSGYQQCLARLRGTNIIPEQTETKEFPLAIHYTIISK